MLTTSPGEQVADFLRLGLVLDTPSTNVQQLRTQTVDLSSVIEEAIAELNVDPKNLQLQCE